jgi:HlyD family secretion protein
MNSQLKPRRWLLLLLVTAGALTVVVAGWWFVLKTTHAQAGAATPVSSAGTTTANAPAAVSAPGHFEPVEPVTHVGAAYIDGHPAMVAELKVAEDDQVSAGQVIAVLAERTQLEAAVRQAELRVALAEARLAQVKGAPRGSDVAAQEAEVARWQLAFDTAQAEYKRYAFLQAKRDVSASEVDAKRTEMENAQRMVEESRARLAGLAELRPEDLRVAQSELDVERAELERERVALATTIVRSPAPGVVLHIGARPGELVGPQGIIELAQTAAMCVIAEVYETDIDRVRLGQTADIVSDLLPGKTLQGKVAAIGREIGRTDIVFSEPAAFADSRVVRVRIQLADSKMVAGLIHGKVTAVIRP